MRAEYGKHVVELASQVLTKEFGQGFSETQIRNLRKFYPTFSGLQIQQTVPAEFKSRLRQIRQTMPAESVTDGIAMPVQLSWNHYERLIRVADPDARFWYMHEAVFWFKSGWIKPLRVGGHAPFSPLCFTFFTSNPQPPSKNDIELKEKEATQKKRLKEVKIATRRHKIPLPHNAT